MTKLVFCEEERGLQIGTTYSELIPAVGARAVFVDAQGVRQMGTVERLTFNYTTSFGGVKEDTLFVRLNNVRQYDEYIEEKRRELRAAV